MKKLYLFTITLLSVVYLSAQVKDFTIVSSKTYENNTRTSYLTLDANLDDDTAILIEKELEQHPDISRFSFYAKPNLSKCMFTTNISLDEQMVVDLMNEITYNFDNTASIKKFKKTNYDGKIYAVAFKLEMPQNKDYIKDAVNLLNKDDKFTDINIIDDIHFELRSYEPINADYVISVFDEFGLKIVDEYILDRF